MSSSLILVSHRVIWEILSYHQDEDRTSDHRILEFNEFWRFLKSLLKASMTDYQMTVFYQFVTETTVVWSQWPITKSPLSTIKMKSNVHFESRLFQIKDILVFDNGPLLMVILVASQTNPLNLAKESISMTCQW